MDRNIITDQDLLLRRSRTRGGGGAGDNSTADDYLARVAKQVPFEIITAYLVLDGIIRSGIEVTSPWLFRALLALFILGLVGSVTFARSVLNVRRVQQLATTAFAFLVWVFATGGLFSLTEWYRPWMGSAAVVLFAVAVRIMRVPPLPEEAKAKTA